MVDQPSSPPSMEQNGDHDSAPQGPQLTASEEEAQKRQQERTDRRLLVITGVVGVVSAIIGAIVSAWTPVGEFLQTEFQQSQTFSEKMNAAIAVLSSEDQKDDKKAAMTLTTIYPLAKNEESKKTLIKLALINNRNAVLQVLSGLVGKDRVGQEIVSSEELSALVKSSPKLQQLNIVTRDQVVVGDVGQDVLEIQKSLGQAGYPVPNTGVFDPQTQKALIDYQTALGLIPDGIVGPATQQALGLMNATQYREEQVPDYQDTFNEKDTDYRTILLKKAVYSGQEGWLYLGVYPESIKDDSLIKLTPARLALLQGSVEQPTLNSVVDISSFSTGIVEKESFVLGKDMYFRKHKPQAQRLGRVIGVLSKGTKVTTQEAWIFRATNRDSRVWARVKIDSIPFDESASSN